MPRLEIGGTSVDFPFAPYECQLAYMEGVIQALNGAHNALLESPTGTGKTLCLLCSTLAWQMTAKARSSPFAGELQQADGAHMQNSATPPQLLGLPPPSTTIVYASRTHSQLSQVVRELKRTVYHPRLSLLGSREQLCVHDTVSTMKGAAMNNACGTLVKGRRCNFHLNLQEGGLGQQSAVLDIEELVAEGKKQSFCPYYFGRSEGSHADLVLMPYNYLLDPSLRRAVKVNWANSIVIFDEAHNLEGVASDSSSFELSSFEIAGAIAELQRCIDRTGEHYTLEYANDAGPDGSSASQKTELLALKDILLRWEQSLLRIILPSNKGTTKRGDFVYELLAAAGVTFETIGEVLGYLERAITSLLDALPIGGTQVSLQLEAVQRALRVCFRGGQASREQCMRQSQLYRVHVTRAASRRSGYGSNSNSRGWGGRPGSEEQPAGNGRVLCYWCFCPGVAMQELKSLGVRSILLTSGTLSPLASFAYELRLPFKIQLENPHVVDANQAWVGTCGTGVTNVELVSTYENRDTPAYKTELGNTIASICRIVPGGMLVFFPTYSVMQRCVEHWQATGIWARICAIKEALHEPRGAADLKVVMDCYDDAIARRGGAILLAVCRGKVSEGVDFSDERARCVIVTGIPFAPTQDPKVDLKRRYMDEAPLPPGITRLSGNDWYVQQAARAVNQAVGRIIRHRFDYGAVVLCDHRFQQERQQANLSKWVRPFVRDTDRFSGVVNGLASFFRSARDDPRLARQAAPERPFAGGAQIAGGQNALKPATRAAVVSLEDTEDAVLGGYIKPGSLEDMENVLAAARDSNADAMRRWQQGGNGSGAGSVNSRSGTSRSDGGSGSGSGRGGSASRAFAGDAGGTRSLGELLGRLNNSCSADRGPMLWNAQGAGPAFGGSGGGVEKGQAAKAAIAEVPRANERGAGPANHVVGLKRYSSNEGASRDRPTTTVRRNSAVPPPGGTSQKNGKSPAGGVQPPKGSGVFGLVRSSSVKSTGIDRRQSSGGGSSNTNGGGGTFEPLPADALKRAAAAAAASAKQASSSPSPNSQRSPAQSSTALQGTCPTQPPTQPATDASSAEACSGDRGSQRGSQVAGASGSSSSGGKSAAPEPEGDPRAFLRDLKSALDAAGLATFKERLKASKSPDVLNSSARFMQVMDGIITLLLSTPPALALSERFQFLIPSSFRKRYQSLLQHRTASKEALGCAHKAQAGKHNVGSKGQGSSTLASRTNSSSAAPPNAARSHGIDPRKSESTGEGRGKGRVAATSAPSSPARISKRAKLMAAAYSSKPTTKSSAVSSAAKHTAAAAPARLLAAAAAARSHRDGCGGGVMLESSGSEGEEDEEDDDCALSVLPPLSQVSASVLKGLERAGAGVSSATTAASSRELPTGMSDRDKRVLCCVCQVPADQPHAAPCHHVCCLSCWRALERQRQHADAVGGAQCPMCRAHTSMSQLVRLVFRTPAAS